MTVGNLGPSGARCVACDQNGNSLAKRSEYLGETTNNIAEFRVALLGLHMELELSARQIHLEGNFLVIVNAIRQNCTPNWKLDQWLRTIRELIGRFAEFKVTHV